MDDINVNVTLPTEIGKLTRLSTLRLVPLAAHGGSIPSEIGSLTKLGKSCIVFRSRETNVGSKMESPVSSLVSFPYNLTEHLAVDGNLFTGNVPSEVGRLTSLTYLQISGGLITG